MRAGSKVVCAVVAAASFAAGSMLQLPGTAGVAPPVENWGSVLDERPATTAPTRLVKDLGKCTIPALGTHPWARAGEGWSAEREAASIEAFELMGLPNAVAVDATQRVRRNDPATVIFMSKAGGRSVGSGAFQPVLHTSYRSEANGRVACLYSTFSFEHEEVCVAWRIEHNGRTYWPGYCVKCDNLSRFLPGPPPAQPAPPIAGEVHYVPEPSSLWLVGLGLVGIIFSRRTT